MASNGWSVNRFTVTQLAHNPVMRSTGIQQQPDTRGGRKPRFALGPPRYDRLMWSLLYLVVRTLLRLLISAGRAGRVDGSKDLENLVLRHQLRVLQRVALVGVPACLNPRWPEPMAWRQFGS